ncbi:nitroreductase [Mycolicibacter kumamotonensis]|jgi:nitroreductase|uniref:Nitroreductase n=1 Tax=Mycolicibacter kumamotonensis TaxID=354243 RepID=A0A1B8SCC1_9MYCO|nr:nitroreductase [Mycolicibacter kumamotonensis]NDJ88993.1 nitroreductase [Mycolicibacter kumamotonensis]OBY30357.1 oxidoreductase [Mycolicibacter kumamotonensis]ORA77423.1 oxidoreductase [Mycolicibacter kumamotonensis]
MSTFDDVVNQRHSSRMFLPDKPVPVELLNEALALAMRAPSNSNIQPWHLFLATGARRESLVAALSAEARANRPKVIGGLPESHNRLRQQLGALVYGAMGIAREDRDGRWNAQLRNWEFFRAPVAGIVCMHRDLGFADAVGVGGFLQTLLLALTERGVDSCVQVSTAMYPDIVREQLEIPDELRILCGVCIGYADPAFPANSLHIPRNPVGENVVFLDT